MKAWQVGAYVFLAVASVAVLVVALALGHEFVIWARRQLGWRRVRRRIESHRRVVRLGHDGRNSRNRSVLKRD